MDFDVIAELWFDADGPWAEVQKNLKNLDAATRARLEADEIQFMGRSSMQAMTVVEHEVDER